MHASHRVLKILKRKASKGWDLIKLIMFTIIDIKWNWLFFDQVHDEEELNDH